MARRKDDSFIPDSDSGFAQMARNFAVNIARAPDRYDLSREESDHLSAVVTRWLEAYVRGSRVSTRNSASVVGKRDARAAAEKLVRRYGGRIRVDDSISTADKISVGIRVRTAKPKHRTVPNLPPVLHFVAGDGSYNNGLGIHRLRFLESSGGEIVARWRGDANRRVHGRAKPDGAARLELFIEMVTPGEKPPKHPGDLSGGRPWYLRSYTRNPIVVKFPIPLTPRLIVYWARWADATGTVGPFSNALVTNLEGWILGMALPQPGSAIDPLQMEAQYPRNAKCLQAMEGEVVEGLLEEEKRKALPVAA